MTREETEALLARIGQESDERFDLFEAALACSLHEDPSRDPSQARTVMHNAAERLADRLKIDRPEEALAEVLSGDLHFTGDLITYDHPSNADLIAVAERRKGLPVALGVFYITAARRCGLGVAGVDFPAHFLLRV